MSYDFSTAEKNTSFDVIPAKTVVPVRVSLIAGDAGPDNVFTTTKSGLYQLVLDLTVTEGEFAKRKIWERLTMGARAGVEMSEGQKKGVQISHSTIRAMLEAAKGFAPTDESAAAVAARKIDSLNEIDGLEFWIEVGVEKSEQYGDKNRMRKVIPHKASAPAGVPAKPAAIAPAAKPATANKPAWLS